MHSYKIIDLIGSGSYGHVYKAIHNSTGCIVAIKVISVMSMENGLPVEVKYLVKYRNCKNIINLIEHFYSSDDKLVLVFEFMEYDLWKFISPKNRYMNLSCVKYFAYQLLLGLNQLHSQKVMHLDIKPANLLVDQCFQLKIADFGFTTYTGNPQLTNQVISLFYRPPELLMGCKDYGTEVDIWSVGCILVEMLTGFYLFAGSSEEAQLDLIFKTMGTPNEKSWPGVSKLPGYSTLAKNSKRYPYRSLKELGKFKYFSSATLDFVLKMLTMNPRDRINCRDALVHPWFKEDPEPQSPPPYIIQSLVSRPVKPNTVKDQNQNNQNNQSNIQVLKNGISIAPKLNQNIYSNQQKQQQYKLELDKIFKTLSDQKASHIEKSKYFAQQVVEYNKKLQQPQQLPIQPQKPTQIPIQQQQPNNINININTINNNINNNNNNQQQQQSIILHEREKLRDLKELFNRFNLQVYNTVQKSLLISNQLQELGYQYSQKLIEAQYCQPQKLGQIQQEQQHIRTKITNLENEKFDLIQQKKQYEYYIQKYSTDIDMVEEMIKQRKLRDYQQQLKLEHEQQRQKIEEMARKAQLEKVQMETYKQIKLIEEKYQNTLQILDNDQMLIEIQIHLYLQNTFTQHQNTNSKLISLLHTLAAKCGTNPSACNTFFIPMQESLFNRYIQVLNNQKSEASLQFKNFKSIQSRMFQPETLLTTIYKLNQMIYDVEILYIKKQNEIDNLKRDQENRQQLLTLLTQLSSINDQLQENLTPTKSRYQTSIQKSNQEQLDKRKSTNETLIQSLITLIHKTNPYQHISNNNISSNMNNINININNNNQKINNLNTQLLVQPQKQQLQQQYILNSNCTTPNLTSTKPQLTLLNINSSNCNIENPITDSRSSSVSPNNNIIPNTTTTTTTTTQPYYKQQEDNSSSTTSEDENDLEEDVSRCGIDDNNNNNINNTKNDDIGKVQNGCFINLNNKRSKDSEDIVSEALDENFKEKKKFSPNVPQTRYQKRLKLLNEQAINKS